MKRNIFMLLTGLVMAGLVNAQTPNIKFSYDAAGNRTQRKQLAIGQNCRKVSPQKDSLAGSTITLYPNPTRNSVNIVMENSADTAKMEFLLYDFSGKLLQNKTLSGSQTTVILSGYTAGTYLLKMRRSKEETVWRIVKVD